MKRYRNRKTTVGVSLFPFLAVLICTMGALIVLLVLVVQMARVDASESLHKVNILEQPDTRLAEKEDYQWRRELLEQQRVKVQEEAAGKRLELSHLEEHIRELEERWEAVRRAAADLQSRMRGKDQDQDASRAQLQQLQEAISAVQQELALAREKAAKQPPVYAIVPYDGPNGTRRRPVYVECTSEGVVIQPEGILLPLQDFLGPLGPGNPLDAALRAIREYYVRLGSTGSQGEPYPLLIVRPGGIESYAMARAAMRSWDDEFGYELVDETMHLKYPDSDPTLGQLLQKVVVNARARQEILAAAMPSRFERKPEVGFVATPTSGGFVAQGGSASRSPGHRQGGFGQGGDSRYIDGQATGPAAGQATPVGEQTVGGSMEKGHAQGKPGASLGTGCSPLANARGRNWGLPGATPRATAIIRPIRVALLPDRLIMLPERGEVTSPVVVLVEGSMVDDIDEFVSKIWDRIEDWGIAVAGGYWKPVLYIHVAQGADERFEEMKTLLDGSGLEAQRSGK